MQAWFYSSSSKTLRTWIWKKKLEFETLTSRRGFTVPVRRHGEPGFERTDLSLNLQAWIHSSRLEIRGAIQIQDTLFEDTEGLDLEEKT